MNASSGKNMNRQEMVIGRKKKGYEGEKEEKEGDREEGTEGGKEGDGGREKKGRSVRVKEGRR